MGHDSRVVRLPTTRRIEQRTLQRWELSSQYCTTHAACKNTCIFRKEYLYIYKPVVPYRIVPHKAVAEVSKIGNYRRGELL